MIKAVIFDLDETMAKNGHVYLNANTALAAKYGKVFDESMRHKMVGKKEYESMVMFREHHGIDCDIEKLVQEKLQMLLENSTGVQATEGLYKLLDLVDHLGIKKAVATGSSRQHAENTLEILQVRERFDVVVTGDDVMYGKPDPQLFLLAASKLEVSPEECLVLEDAQNGVEAAFRAGMKVFAIPSEYSYTEDFSKATRVFSSMKEIDVNVLHSIGSPIRAN